MIVLVCQAHEARVRCERAPNVRQALLDKARTVAK